MNENDIWKRMYTRSNTAYVSYTYENQTTRANIRESETATIFWNWIAFIAATSTRYEYVSVFLHLNRSICASTRVRLISFLNDVAYREKISLSTASRWNTLGKKLRFVFRFLYKSR